MAAGIRPVLFARHEAQKSAGSRLGAEIGDKEDGFDLVVECAGTESALEEAITRCRPGGTVLMLGIYWDGMSVPGMLLGLKEVRLVPSYLYGREGTVRDMDTAAALLASRTDFPLMPPRKRSKSPPIEKRARSRLSSNPKPRAATRAAGGTSDAALFENSMATPPRAGSRSWFEFSRSMY
jgi:hypothetical protein